eukprot:1184474-Rhodomonas_salina.1
MAVGMTGKKKEEKKVKGGQPVFVRKSRMSSLRSCGRGRAERMIIITSCGERRRQRLGERERENETRKQVPSLGGKRNARGVENET